MTRLLALFLWAVTAFAQTCQCGDQPDWKPCVISTNVVDRFAADVSLVELDQRPNEFGYHTPVGSWHPIRFVDVPAGHEVRIVGYDLDAVARWTLRETGWQRTRSAWGLVALHTKDYSKSPYIVEPPAGRDVLKWAQMPVADQRHKLYSGWRDNMVVNGVLPGNILYVKHALFNNIHGQEVQIETTGEFFFCYQAKGGV